MLSFRSFLLEVEIRGKDGLLVNVQDLARPIGVSIFRDYGAWIHPELNVYVPVKYQNHRNVAKMILGFEDDINYRSMFADGWVRLVTDHNYVAVDTTEKTTKPVLRQLVKYIPPHINKLFLDEFRPGHGSVYAEFDLITDLDKLFARIK